MRPIVLIWLLFATLSTFTASAQKAEYLIPQYDPAKISDSFIKVLKYRNIDTIFLYQKTCGMCLGHLKHVGSCKPYYTYRAPFITDAFVIWSERGKTCIVKFDAFGVYDTARLENKAPFAYLNRNFTRINKDSFTYTRRINQFDVETIGATADGEQALSYLYISNNKLVLSKNFNTDMPSIWDEKFLKYFASADYQLVLLLENDLNVFLAGYQWKPLTEYYFTKKEFNTWRKKQKTD